MIRVLVWNEYLHEKQEENIARIYPNGIHNAIADFLKCDDIVVKTATLEDENCGITKEILDETDVLIWWAHIGHKKVPDEVAKLVKSAVMDGMGAIFLHSAHLAKPFTMLTGTSCNLTWRESDDSEILWVIEPSHPITKGIDRYFKLEKEETYGEPFVIPTPDKLIFIGSYSSGEVFRSGCLYDRGNGKIFYFQPGHESYPIYYVPEVQTVIRNAVRYLAPIRRFSVGCPETRKIGDQRGYIVE